MRRRVIATAALFVLTILVVVSGCDYFKVVTTPVIHPTIDLIIVEKTSHRMVLLHNGQVQKVYYVALGRGGLGPKEIAGDNKVPEGTYRITGRNPRSAFHLSLRIDYPTSEQAQAAQRNGLDPGGDVMIHGIRNGLGWIGGLHRKVDWTRGCIAVTDREIEEIWRIVPDGTVIVIRP